MLEALLVYIFVLLTFLPAYYFTKDKGFILSIQHSLFLSLAAMTNTIFLIAAIINIAILLVLFLIRYLAVTRKQRGSLS
ncbi:hypothetical protein [Caldicellulosiruptor acetigenus]|uniref:Uncharacterized protein n=1 Tax=Caldicellulosiruptor acetigenus 6A TaxID=632516 RepID=G2PWI0_9FIRM|nr:hypothetical protein [Caldicellulosiruptor acetigenus]AEM72924.1 hypothetical protein Calla_0244 [Caldicellulosiruptor acetigenus 6A]